MVECRVAKLEVRWTTYLFTAPTICEVQIDKALYFVAVELKKNGSGSIMTDIYGTYIRFFLHSILKKQAITFSIYIDCQCYQNSEVRPLLWIFSGCTCWTTLYPTCYWQKPTGIAQFSDLQHISQHYIHYFPLLPQRRCFIAIARHVYDPCFLANSHFLAGCSWLEKLWTTRLQRAMRVYHITPSVIHGRWSVRAAYQTRVCGFDKRFSISAPHLSQTIIKIQKKKKWKE